MKVLRCREIGFDCEGVVRAESEEEVLQIAGAHAKSVHNVEITPEMARQIRTLIRNEPNRAMSQIERNESGHECSR